jgi:hypothetical protein
MKSIHFVRMAVLTGVVGAATLVGVLAPSAAMADVRNPPIGSQPGHLTLNPSSGASSLKPAFSTDTPCPVGQQSSAIVDVAANDGTNQGLLTAALPGTVISNPAGFSGTLSFTMAQALSVAGPAGQTYEFVVECRAGTTPNFVQSTFVTFDATGANWTSSPTPPVQAQNTATALAANFTSVPFGTNVTLTATVTPSGATGNVQFIEGGVVFATVSLTNGTASTSTSTLQVGDHSITAHYVGNAAFNASTSTAVTVTVTPAGTSGSETINVNVPLSEGVFTLTVSSTPVQMTDAVNNGTQFVSTGTLSDVTVSDGRLQSAPGWSVSGQVSDFTSGGNSFSGTNLGWTPAVKTQNAASDVVAGPVVAPGTTPGLKGGSGLASAGVAKGIGTSVLNAALDLRVPLTTKVGAYSALLTVTAITHA